MLTLWYHSGLRHTTPIEGLIAHTHTLFITETASRHTLSITEHDIFEHQRHLAIAGMPEQIFQFLHVLTEHGICGLELVLPAETHDPRFDIFGRDLTITRQI